MRLSPSRSEGTVTAVALGILFANLTALEMVLKFPHSLADIIAVRIPFFALRCALTAALVFALTASPRPSARTFVMTGLAAFAIMALFLTLAGVFLRAGSVPEYRRYGLTLIPLMLLALSATFTLPPVLCPPGKRLVWGLWWQPVLALITIGSVLIGTGAMLPGGILEHVAQWAARMGGHYYTVLNFSGPAIQIAFATAAASWLGLAWAKAHNRCARQNHPGPITR